MKYVIAILYLIVGLINFAPLSGVLGAARLETLYGVTGLDADMALLLRHRAVLFGIVGGIILIAAFKTSMQPLANIIGSISMVSYVVLFHLTGADGDPISRVYMIDLAAIALLILAMVLGLFNKPSTSTDDTPPWK